MSTKNILVTGGAGYIGSHACKALAQAGYTPVTLDNLCVGHRWAVRWGPLIEGDVRDEALVRSTLRTHAIDSVMHFAGSTSVAESMRDPGMYFDNNVGGTLALLNAMQAEGVRVIVFSSTCATYGAPEALPLAEDHPQRPINPYGESKLVCERLLHWFSAAFGMRYAALRYFNAAGADADGEIGQDHDPTTLLIPLAIFAAQGRSGPLSIFGTDYATPDGTAIRDYVHVTDLASAHVSALARLFGQEGNLHLNLGTGRGASVREVVRMVERVGARPVPLRETGRRAGDPPELVASNAAAQSLLQWQPRHSDLENIVATAWAWHARQSVRERSAAAAE